MPMSNCWPYATAVPARRPRPMRTFLTTWVFKRLLGRPRAKTGGLDGQGQQLDVMASNVVTACNGPLRVVLHPLLDCHDVVPGLSEM